MSEKTPPPTARKTNEQILLDVNRSNNQPRVSNAEIIRGKLERALAAWSAPRYLHFDHAGRVRELIGEWSRLMDRDDLPRRIRDSQVKDRGDAKRILRAMLRRLDRIEATANGADSPMATEPIRRTSIDEANRKAIELPTVATTPAGSTGSTTATEPTKPSKKKRRMFVDEANRKAMELAKSKRKQFTSLSERKQAIHIGCCWTTWSKTQLYKSLYKKKEGGKPATNGDTNAAHPVITLPPNTEDQKALPPADQLIAEEDTARAKARWRKSKPNRQWSDLSLDEQQREVDLVRADDRELELQRLTAEQKKESRAEKSGRFAQRKRA